MADATKPARRARGRAQDAQDEASERTSDAEETTHEATDQASDQAQDAGRGAGELADAGRSTLSSELKDTIREAAVEVLKPVARKATTAAAKYAVTKGPSLVNDKLMPKVEEAGGPLELAKKAGGGVGGLASKVKGGGEETPSGTGRGRRLPIQESVDVAVPLETAYNQFTQFEDFPQFMHRVERVEQKDDSHLMWHENIWGVRRQWEAEITEQQPDERIAWESTSGSPMQKGVVTFHRLSDRLTRIEVSLDQQPKGLFEKTASGFRMTRRALKSDLMRLKAFLETRDEETGAWRGEIEEGEAAGGEEERPERGEAEAEERDESRTRGRRRGAEAEEEEHEDDEEEYEDEQEGEEEPEAQEEPEGDEEEEEEEERQPQRRQVKRRRPAERPAGRRSRR